jgi:scyllo-inositol 2-dehydrogenase (NADP+)
MRQVGIGIIGFGRIGAEHAGWLNSCENAKVVAVADATPARQAMAIDRGLKVYPTIDAMLREPHVEAVLVATPTAMHFEHVTTALSAGRHVLVEKPMALDLEQSRKLVEDAERRGLILSVFHNRRWDLDYLTLKHALDTGTFGKIINVESRLGQWESCVGPAAKEYRPNWRNEAPYGGGGLYDWGSHFVDQIWRLLWPARPVRVFAQLRGNVWSSDCDDLARLLIDFDSGSVGLVEINTTTTCALSRWHIDGTRGSASSPHSPDFDTRMWAAFEYVPPPDIEGGAPQALPITARGLTESQIWEHFALAMRGNGIPAVNARSVLPTMALMDAARESSKSGCAVHVADRVEWIL